MDNEKFQELVLKKLDKVDSLGEKLDSLDGKVGSLDKKADSLDAVVNSLHNKVASLDYKVNSLDEKVDSLDERQGNLECDFKLMFKMMSDFSDKLNRIENIVVRIENDTTTRVRALFEKYDIHNNRLENHESRIKVLEAKK